MPTNRMRRSRARRIDPSATEKLRATVARGIPWLRTKTDEADAVGRGELIALVNGHHYGFVCRFWTDPDDAFFWSELRADILAQHIKRRPGTRPAAWWKFDAPEPRRLVGRDRDEGGNGHDDGRLPAADDPNLPDWAKGKTYFGRPSVYDGFLYETQRAYLERLNFLTDIEKEIFAKYTDIVFARVSAGDNGKCAECWEHARKAAKKIDFDLDGSALPFNTFWLPQSLLSDCTHTESNQGIFSQETF